MEAFRSERRNTNFIDSKREPVVIDSSRIRGGMFVVK